MSPAKAARTQIYSDLKENLSTLNRPGLRDKVLLKSRSDKSESERSAGLRGRPFHQAALEHHGRHFASVAYA